MIEPKSSVRSLQLGIVCFAILSVLMLGLHIGGALATADRLAFEWMKVVRADWITTFLSALTFLGGASALAPLGIILVIVCFLKGYRTEALMIFLTLLVAYLLNEGMKAYFARPRPEGIHLIDLPTSYSFPSGHAMVGAAFYLILAFILKGWYKEKSWSSLIQPAAIVLVFLLAASRVYLGVHYLSDVLTGFCLSMVLYFGARITYHRWEKRRSAIVSPLETSR